MSVYSKLKPGRQRLVCYLLLTVLIKSLVDTLSPYSQRKYIPAISNRQANYSSMSVFKLNSRGLWH
jgi:hypothetical protein